MSTKDQRENSCSNLSAFNRPIFGNAMLGELFERKSLHLIIIICEMLTCLYLFILRHTLFLLPWSLPLVHDWWSSNSNRKTVLLQCHISTLFSKISSPPASAIILYKGNASLSFYFLPFCRFRNQICLNPIKITQRDNQVYQIVTVYNICQNLMQNVLRFMVE